MWDYGVTRTKARQRLTMNVSRYKRARLCQIPACLHFESDQKTRPNDEKIRMRLVEVLYLVFTRMPGETYRNRFRSLLLCLCDVFRTLINSLVCWFCLGALGLVLFQIVIKNKLIATAFGKLIFLKKSEIETITIGQVIHTHIFFAYLAFFEKQANTSLIFIWH